MDELGTADISLRLNEVGARMTARGRLDDRVASLERLVQAQMTAITILTESVKVLMEAVAEMVTAKEER